MIFTGSMLAIFLISALVFATLLDKVSHMEYNCEDIELPSRKTIRQPKKIVRSASSRLVLLFALGFAFLPHGASAKNSSDAPAKSEKKVVAPPARPPLPPQLVIPSPPPIPDLPRTTYIQQMDSEYRKHDLDGDGKVTRLELVQFERAQAFSQAQTNNAALFLSLDVDRNGSLTPGEFAALVKDPSAPDVTPLMQRFDSNRDQIISIVEYRAATLINFDRLDADKDGVVTDAEVTAGAPKPIQPGSR